MLQNSTYYQEYIINKGKRVSNAQYTVCIMCLESNVTLKHAHMTTPKTWKSALLADDEKRTLAFEIFSNILPKCLLLVSVLALYGTHSCRLANHTHQFKSSDWSIFIMYTCCDTTKM